MSFSQIVVQVRLQKNIFIEQQDDYLTIISAQAVAKAGYNVVDLHFLLQCKTAWYFLSSDFQLAKSFDFKGVTEMVSTGTPQPTA